ncbi:extracellular solute-binding protein [Metabacillus sediminilitoris]|uniref:Extracellular solute-binding protein n=1 Tax=Metabacillus sediminilitoris TaxID=2567941 RepID=A0A4S4BQK6_9BACI|nr:extracellular solute-binding protein [Metabacillus sediminilitoris]QGQ45656.1 extracellular solute-binding protein [Metabacillus sediminilitoris]THF77225.1 extracellular solute-binding protein [Metabacillus sediminilitoris]
MKRLLFYVTILILATILLAGCGKKEEATVGSDGVEQELVVAGNQDMTDLMNQKIFKSFQEKYPDTKVTYIPGNGAETAAKVKAQKNSPQIDVAILEINSQIDGYNNKLWSPLNKEDIPSMNKIVHETNIPENSGVPVFYSPHVVSYNKELVESKGLPVLTSWNDLALPELKGKVALQDPAGSFGRTALIMLAYANGGSESQIEPGFKKLAEIASNQSTFYKNQSFINQALQDDSAAYTVWALNRHHTYREEGNLPLEFVVPKEGVYISNSGIATLVDGAKHPNAAKKFIDFMLSDEVQKLLAEDLYLNPVTDVKVSSEVAKKLEFDKSNSKEFDNNVISSEFPKWLERFNQEISPLIGKDM